MKLEKLEGQAAISDYLFRCFGIYFLLFSVKRTDSIDVDFMGPMRSLTLGPEMFPNTTEWDRFSEYRHERRMTPNNIRDGVVEYFKQYPGPAPSSSISPPYTCALFLLTLYVFSHKINVLERMSIYCRGRETLVRLDSNLCGTCALVLVRRKVADMWADQVDRLKVINGTLPLSSSEPPLPSLHGMPPQGGL